MSPRARLARQRLWLGLTGALMLLGLGLLLRGSLRAAAREQLLRREALAARVFDELEGALAGFIAAEEARPFVQWRREWVPPASPIRKGPAAGSGRGPQPSPLAALPQRGFVRGYFQIEPDGSFASPMDPSPEGEGEAGQLERVEELRVFNEDLREPTRLAQALPQQAQQQPLREPPSQQQQQAVPEDIQIQRALDQQAINRQRKNAEANAPNFDPEPEQLSNFLNKKGNASLEEATLDTGDALDVRVTGFVVEPRGDQLRLLRTVEIGGQRWLQGLVVERAGLERWLEQEVLGSPELAGLVRLDWSAQAALQPAAPEQGRFVHRFAPPFALLEVQAELGPPELLASTSARLILALGLALVLALIAALVAVERTLTGMHERAAERERFVAAVTHELRTPLTSIRMYSEMLEQGMVASADKQRRYHGTIRTEAERLSRLVDQVLSLARLDGGEGRAAPGEAPALATTEDIVAGVVELLAPLARERGLELRVELEDGAAAARLPRDPLAQILTNLVDNAIKFSPAGVGARAGPVEIVGRRRGDRVTLAVRDHGPGVDAQLRARMFEPFVRGEASERDAVAGTGIGLAVVRSLVDDLGGRVQVQNRPAGGLEIELELPI